MDTPKPDSAFELAVRLVGGQNAMGRLVGKHQTTVRERLLKGQPLWAENVLAVESATGISRHDLRPDIYPLESSGIQPGDAPSGGLADAPDGARSSDLAA